MERKNLAVELIARLLPGKIKAQTRTSLVQEKKYSEHLIEAQRKYHNRMIESLQVIAEIIAMAKDMQAAMKRDEETRTQPRRDRLLRRFCRKPEVLQTMGDATLKRLATELTESFAPASR